MKRMLFLPGIILLGIGVFYCTQNLNIQLFENQNSWQSLLILLGAAFLISGHFEKDNSAILPGVILVGIGLHFTCYGKVPSWPDHSAAFLFIVALGLLLTAIKTKTGYFQGAILLAVGLFLHFFQSITQSLPIDDAGVQLFKTYWPLLLILIGGYLLFSKRKK